MYVAEVVLPWRVRAMPWLRGCEVPGYVLAGIMAVYRLFLLGEYWSSLRLCELGVRKFVPSHELLPNQSDGAHKKRSSHKRRHHDRRRKIGRGECNL